MKKKIFCLMLAAIVAMPMVTNAETPSADPNETSKEVVVGEVDEAVYSFDINWLDFSYDWKYNRETKSFEFRPKLKCGQILGSSVEQYADEKYDYTLYSDDTCSTKYTGEIQKDDKYYIKTINSGFIQFIDYSKYGRAIPKVRFTPSESYNGIVGKFYRFTFVSEKPYDEIEYLYFNVEDEHGLCIGANIEAVYYQGYLKLEVTDEFSGEKAVKTGDIIGTVTLEIRQIAFWEE